MNTHLQRAKKRITHIGQTSAEMQSDDHDIVSEILKEIGFSTEYSKAVDSMQKAQEKSVSCKSYEQVSLGTSSMPTQSKIKMPKPSKRFFPEKKYPLMAKCQRNLKHLKHNRSVPKQRAHITAIPSSPNTHLPGGQNNKASHGKEKLVAKPSFDTRQSPTLNSESISHFENSDNEKSSSDRSSNSEFENFIREQKRMLESDETDSESLSVRKKHKSKKKRKKKSSSSSYSVTVSQISRKKLDESDISDSSSNSCIDKSKSFITSKTKSETKYKKCKKRKLSSSNLQYPEISLKTKLDISDISDDSISTDINKSKSFVISEKNKTRHKSKKLNIDSVNDSNSASDADGMSFGEFTDSDTSIFENRNLNSDNEVDTIISENCPETEKTGNVPLHLFCFDLTKADTMEYIAKHFSCQVRIKRDPILDKRVAFAADEDTSLNNTAMFCESIELSDQSNIVHNSTIPRDGDFEVVLENTSDDDCQFLCEIPVSKFSAKNNVFPKSNEKDYHIHDSFQNSKNDSGINNGNATFSSSTVERESKLNVKIAAIHSLRESNYSDNHSVKVFQNNTNTINTADIIHDKNHNVFSNSNQTTKDTKQCSNRLLIPNLDQLLGNIDFRLISEISKQPSVSDVTSIDNAQIVSAPERYQLSQCPLPPAKITRNISTGDEQKTLKFTSSLEDNSASDHLKFASDPSILKDVDTVKDDTLKLPIEPNIKEIDKIDFKKILLSANSEQSTNPCIETNIYSEYGNLIPKYNQLQPLVISEKTDISLPILSQDNFWQDLKDAVTINNCISNNSYPNLVKESKTERNFTHSLVIGDNPNSNRMAKSKNETAPATQAASMINERNLLHQPETVLDESEILKVDSVKEEDPYERPSYELDCIATASIRELCEPKQSISPLFNLYSEELRHYENIVSTEMNVSAGLKMLEEKQAKKIKYLRKAILNLVQHDPCFQKVKEKKCSFFNKLIDHYNITENMKVETQESEFYAPGVACSEDSSLKDVIQSKQGLSKQVTNEGIRLKSGFESKQNHLKQSHKCDNCEKQAKFRCQNCRKAFFCSVKCGEDFWEKKHSNNCDQLKEAATV